MKKYKINTQISIDGTQEQHDKRRIYHDGRGTYELIKKNLDLLCKNGLKELITIRLNIDSENIDDCENIMIPFLEYSDDIYFGFIDSFKGANDSFGDCISIEEHPIYVTDKFYKCYKKYGLPAPKLFGKNTPCSMNSEGKFFIDNKLDVYKCEMLLNRTEAKVGVISMNGVFIPEAGFYNQMTVSPAHNKECLDCVLLPMCRGGCYAKKYINDEKKDGKVDQENCLLTENQLIMYLKHFIDNGN